MALVYVAGTGDTKGNELSFLKAEIEAAGARAVIVDLGTQSAFDAADISAETVAGHHPQGRDAVLGQTDRGRAIEEMSRAFVRFIVGQSDVDGIIGIGGSGGTALITPAMRAVPIGIPKVMVSTVASGNVAPYVGPSDIAMMYSVTDIAGLNRISRTVLGNAARAIAGMAVGIGRNKTASHLDVRPPIGLTMFGVTTPCISKVTAELNKDYDCMVFHATGTGGQSMEKLAGSGMFRGVVDATTTEVCDYLMGGVFACTEERFDVFAETRLPYVGSCGALDMVNFGAIETVPSQYRNRKLHVHNSQVTLMRTTPEENVRIGRFIAQKLNKCEGEVRFLLPLAGVSMIDAPGQPFYDQEADMALFATIRAEFKPTKNRRLIELDNNINDDAFAFALAQNFREIVE